MTERTKYVAVIVGGTPEEPWDVEVEFEADSLMLAAVQSRNARDHTLRQRPRNLDRGGAVMYVYVCSERATADSFGVWTVGFYAPDGNWHPESDHDSPQAAAERVHWLNGGDREVTITNKVEASWPCCDYSPLPGICGAKSPRSYSCTRALGHVGPHIACGDKDHRLDTWTDREIESA